MVHDDTIMDVINRRKTYAGKFEFTYNSGEWNFKLVNGENPEKVEPSPKRRTQK